MATLKLDLLVDKEKNRVLFAECRSDFADILFSFLTLPLGTIIRLLGKQSLVGCLDKLYESVEDLDTDFFGTKACQTLLLHPRNSAEAQCGNLKINIDDSKTDVYSCGSMHYCKEYSLTCGLLCDCWNPMNEPTKLTSAVFGAFVKTGATCGLVCNCCDPTTEPTKLTSAVFGAFVKTGARFIIRDDFQIIPLSAASTFAVLQQYGIKNAASLERKRVDVGKDEVLHLLKMTLVSSSPLSDVFLKKSESNISVAAERKFIGTDAVKIETDSITDTKKIHMKLFYSIHSNKFFYAEGGDDLADLLLGSLTFPLGSVVKILNKVTSLGCVDNLYKSVEHLGTGDYIISEKEKKMLLDPKLYIHHGCRDAMVKIDEDSTYKGYTVKDPKSQILGIGKGGFAKNLAKFVVSEDMVVAPLSPISIIEIHKGLHEPVGSLAEMEISIGKAEALRLLQACLVSRTPLKELFFVAKQEPKA